MKPEITYRALVVGGQPNFIKGTFAPKLMEHGISVDWHHDWNQKRAPKALPTGCNLVLCIKDMVSHRLRDPAHKVAKASGVQALDVQRKWAHALQTLTDAGVIPRVANEGESMAQQYMDQFRSIREYAMAQDGRRPSNTEASRATGVPVDFVGMTKAITDGVAMSGVAFTEKTTKERKELELQQALENARDVVMMIFEDDPELLAARHDREQHSYVLEMLDAPPPNNYQLKTIFKEVREELRETFEYGKKRGRASKEGQVHRDRLRHMKTRFAAKYIERAKEEGKKLSKTDCQNQALKLFGSKIPKDILDETFGTEGKTEVNAENLPSNNTQQILKESHRFGKEPDRVIAIDISAEINHLVAPAEVKAVREVLGIPAFEVGVTREPDVMPPEEVEAELPDLAEISENMDASQEEMVEILDDLLNCETADEADAPEVSAEPEGEDMDELDAAIDALDDPEDLEEAEVISVDVLKEVDAEEREPRFDEAGNPMVFVNGHWRSFPRPSSRDAHTHMMVAGDDRAAQIGNAVATLIRAGCKVSFTIDTE